MASIRKTKSRLTKVDLDAVLKLQREHTELEQRLTRLLEYVVGLNKGVFTAFTCGDDIIDFIAREVAKIAKKRQMKIYLKTALTMSYGKIQTALGEIWSR